MSAAPLSRNERIAQLRAEVRAVTAHARSSGAPALPFGIDMIDTRLADGGIADAALHEIAGADASIGSDAAATLFIAGIAARRAGREGTVLWTLRRRDLFAPGLAQAGLTPDRLLIAEAGRDEDVLAVMEDALRHGALAVVVGEVGRAGLTATRRLQLAAEEGRTTALMLRRWRKTGVDPLGEPSSALTRWRIGCVASGELPVAGVGPGRWRVELARQRGGDIFTLIMEACDAQGRLALPADAGDRSVAQDRRGDRQAA